MAELELKDYKPNSNRSRETGARELPEKKKVEKLDIGEVKSKKKSGFSRFRDSVIKEDAHNVGSFVMEELFIPKLIDMIVDMGKGAIEMAFYGETRSADRGRRSPGSRISYSSYYDDDGRRWKDRVHDGRYRDEIYYYDELKFNSRSDADSVLDGMYGILDQYKVVTVADLFDLVGMPGRYTDNKWGWTDLRGSYIRRIGREYTIELPKPMPID